MRVGSLCTGYGGLEMGLRVVFPFARLAWVADNDKAASTLLAARYPGVPNLGDITKVDWSLVERVDLLAAGIPCQPHSYAGKQQGKDDDRDLVETFIQAVRELRPRVVILENVPGFKRWGLPRVLGALAEMGFDAVWHSVRASEAGASHRRERVFLVAYAQDDGCPGWWSAWLWGLGPEDRGRDVLPDSHGERLQGNRQETDPPRGEGEASADPEHGPVPEWPWGAGRQVRELTSVGGEPGGGSEAAANANGSARGGWSDEPIGGSEGREALDGHSEVDWGEYEPAIRRQERVFGRLAPAPTEIGPKGNVRLAPRFPEWMMGVPDGHVTDFGFSRVDTFRLIGNGVVPLQAALAIWGLWNDIQRDLSSFDGRSDPSGCDRAAA